MPELACQKVEDHYILRDGAAGLFQPSQFPRNRETARPMSMNYCRTRWIDPKYEFLFRAPVADPEGNRAQVRFSRKTRSST